MGGTTSGPSESVKVWRLFEREKVEHSALDVHLPLIVVGSQCAGFVSYVELMTAGLHD